MRNAINTTANVTTIAIVNRSVRTAMVGVDALRTSPRHLRLYSAPALHRWAHFASRKQSAAARKQQLAGKQKPAACLGGQGMPGGDASRLERAPRCRRPRLSSCLRGS